jgi:glycosyltransferase involved in cell wall biosynthesis
VKILHTVEFYPPSKGGAQEVVRQLSERLADAGHDVTVATTKLPGRKSKTNAGVKIAEFDIKGKSVTKISGETKKYQDFLVNGDFDIVMNYAAQQWATDLSFAVLDKIKAKKIIVPCGYSALHHPDYQSYFERLPAYLKKYDASVYASPTYQDIVFAKKHKIQNLHVIPNGADEREFNNLSGRRKFRKKYGIKHFFMLTIGSHTNAKGHDEALNVFEHFPYPCTLVIIGNKSEDGCYEKCVRRAEELNYQKRRRRKKVLVLDLNREDTVAALKAADLFLFLSNREASPLALFEAAAAGTPFVASAAGNAAEIADWTGGGVITKSIPHPGRPGTGDVTIDVQATVRLLKMFWANPLRRRRLGKLGRKNWHQKYTWEHITKQYLQLYEELLR